MQFGKFTINENPLDNLTKYSGLEILKFEFNNEVASLIQRDLYFLGIRYETIFPDLDEFSMDLKIKFNFAAQHSKSKC